MMFAKQITFLWEEYIKDPMSLVLSVKKNIDYKTNK